MAPSSESLSYPPSALIGAFGYYSAHHAEATADGYVKDSHGNIIKSADQQAIANKAYGGRMANNQSGDGWRYRGRGMKQVTGKANYREFGADYPIYWAIGAQDFVSNPALLVEMPYALRSAVWFWTSKGCMKKADGGIRNQDIDAVTTIVNSNEVGTSKGQERRNFTNQAYGIFR